MKSSLVIIKLTYNIYSVKPNVDLTFPKNMVEFLIHGNKNCVVQSGVSATPSVRPMVATYNSVETTALFKFLSSVW